MDGNFFLLEMEDKVSQGNSENLTGSLGLRQCPHPIFICDVYVCAICECDKSAEMPASRLCMSAQYVLVTHHYFSFINNCTLVLHTHTGRSNYYSLSCWCRSSLHIVLL